MCKEIKPCCTPVAPPWEVPQVIPAQLRRVTTPSPTALTGVPVGAP